MNLWSDNHPKNFWCCLTDFPDDAWHIAIRKALPILGFFIDASDIDTLLYLILGEGQFYRSSWQLSTPRKLYYYFKPMIPKQLRYSLRRLSRRMHNRSFLLGWPVEDRYARFQWEVLRQLCLETKLDHIEFRYFWPDSSRFALVLTHDIETAEGQAYASAIADIEQALGFHSSFNFVPEGYKLDRKLIADLLSRGFEVGIHGLRHDGKLFRSFKTFSSKSERINQYLADFGASGFRSPLTHRNPEWMQLLAIEYDSSFFDSDPFEPLPGGVMSIWPFKIGHFIELPYTLCQDCTLFNVLAEKTPRLWHEKLGFIEQYYGMALINTHPDYLRDDTLRAIYIEFLETIKSKGKYWHALPRHVAQWWRVRTGEVPPGHDVHCINKSIIFEDEQIRIL